MGPVGSVGPVGCYKKSVGPVGPVSSVGPVGCYKIRGSTFMLKILYQKFGRKNIFFTVLYRSPAIDHNSPNFQAFLSVKPCLRMIVLGCGTKVVE